jgi:F0F1-type ATP synthase assembly protein I
VARRRFGTRPWLLVAGIALGAIGGFIRIVRSVPAAHPFTPTEPAAADENPDEALDPRDREGRSR